MLKYIRASSATPGYFPPVVDGSMTLADGGVVMSVDFPTAIEHCREMVSSDEDIYIDIIMVQRGTSFYSVIHNLR